MRLRLLLLALIACTGEIGTNQPGVDEPRELEPGESEGGGSFAVPSTTTRRLSRRELGNTIEAVTGLRPASLAQLPPDSTGVAFDRVVDVQTMSDAHLRAYLAIGEELATTLVRERRLDEISDVCPDDIIPSDVPSVTFEASGEALSGGGLMPVADEPGTVYSLYRPNFSVGYTYDVAAPGNYEVILRGLVRSRVDEIEVTVDGESVGTFSDAAEMRELPVTFAASESGTVSIEFDFRTDPPNHNLRVDFASIAVTGPIDSVTPDPVALSACAASLSEDFAARAYRRPLRADESQGLMRVYEAGVSAGGEGVALRLLLEAIFSSPYHTYLVEVGESDPALTRVSLTAWEIAARISYALCETPPDEPLRAAAAAGELSEGGQRVAHARRLLASECGHSTLQHFFAQWLRLDELADLDKSPEEFPEFNDGVREGLIAESQAFVEGAIWGDEGTLENLFTSDNYRPDPRSAYLSDDDMRAGALMLPGFLAVTASYAETAPVFRGVYVLEEVLCAHLPEPPDDIEITPPEPSESLNSRERWEAHSARAECAVCHDAIDPIGFAFETFDALGVYRPEENGRPIDPTGGIPALGIPDGSLPDAVALVQELGRAEETHECVSRQWLRFVLGRLDLPADAPVRDVLRNALIEGTMVDAFVSVIGHEAFIYREQDQDASSEDTESGEQP